MPNLPTRLAEAESYAERLFEYRSVDRLETSDALAALTDPASNEGVSWDDPSAQWVVTESGGYPYSIQQFGKTVWDAAEGPDRITLDDALVGVTEGQRELDVGFLLSRWERATKTERAFLRAMSVDSGDGSRMSDLVERLGKASAQALSPARAKLISKGIVYSPEHGVVAYTVPGMADYVARREPEER